MVALPPRQGIILVDIGINYLYVHACSIYICIYIYIEVSVLEGIVFRVVWTGWQVTETCTLCTNSSLRRLFINRHGPRSAALDTAP